MIKASELRIGNLLLFSNGIQPDKIITVGRRFFSSAAIEKEDGDFEVTPYYRPIPLTKEWLLRFGFDEGYSNGTSKYWLNLSSVHGVYLAWVPDLSEIRLHESSGDGGTYGIPIIHVHQLQNLYFALTGQELTRKTEP